MADFATALRTRLLAAPPVAAITTKIHWGQVPQGTALPYIRLQTISDPLDEHLKGYTDTQRPRVQADCFASTYAVARDLAAKLIASLALPATTGGVAFNRIKAEGPRDLGEDVAGVGFVHRASVDLLVEHKLV
jgi:hypothetical protein